jgi:hypothetical protein
MINEELKKRAAQKPAPPSSAPEITARLRPAEERPRGFPVLTLFIVLIPLIALGAWFLVKGLQMDGQPKTVREEAGPVKEVVAARAPEPPSRAPAPVPVPAVAVLPPTAPTTSALPAAEPVFRLQGLYWRPSRPSAVVNGKTVYVGDRVETARVTAIDQQSVTLNVNGQAKTLSVR